MGGVDGMSCQHHQVLAANLLQKHWEWQGRKESSVENGTVVRPTMYLATLDVKPAFDEAKLKHVTRIMDDHHTQMADCSRLSLDVWAVRSGQPYTVTIETWKERKESMEHLNDRTWCYHGMNADVMKIRSSVLNSFWREHISDQNGRRGNIPPYAQAPFAAVPRATISFAMTVMDKLEGWNDEKWVGSMFAASMWIYTKAELCDWRGRDPPMDLRKKFTIIMESASWVTTDYGSMSGSRSTTLSGKKRHCGSAEI